MVQGVENTYTSQKIHGYGHHHRVHSIYLSLMPLDINVLVFEVVFHPLFSIY